MENKVQIHMRMVLKKSMNWHPGQLMNRDVKRQKGK